jgi:RNA polymerase sigma-70 factor (ECF subfamily)
VARWPDNELVKRILAGQQQACTELVDLHHEAIYRFLAHLCQDVHWAEDLAQETFTTAWSRLGSFNGKASLATWLHRIAYCKFVDALRQRRRRVPAKSAVPLEQVTACDPAPIDAILADERERELYEALGQLDSGDREVLALHYFQDFSFSEMADVLGIRTGLAKWRTSQALGRLRQLLGEA